MNDSSRKITRIDRILAVEEQEMKMLASNLQTIEQQIRQHAEEKKQIEREIDSAGESPSKEISIDRLQHLSVWTDILKSKLVSREKTIVEHEAQRDEIQQTILEKRSTILAWEKYREILREGVESDLQRKEELEAVDRFLGNHGANQK